MKNTISKLIAVLLAALMIASFSACGKNSTESDASSEQSVSSVSDSSSTDEAKISLTLNVDNLGEKSSMTVETDGDTLYDALNDNGLIEGTNGEYGFFVTSFNGIVADGSDGSYWMFKDADGEYFSTAVDSTPVKDGDTVNIVREKY